MCFRIGTSLGLRVVWPKRARLLAVALRAWATLMRSVNEARTGGRPRTRGGGSEESSGSNRPRAKRKRYSAGSWAKAVNIASGLQIILSKRLQTAQGKEETVQAGCAPADKNKRCTDSAGGLHGTV